MQHNVRFAVSQAMRSLRPVKLPPNGLRPVSAGIALTLAGSKPAIRLLGPTDSHPRRVFSLPRVATAPRETSAEAALRVLQEVLGLYAHPSQILGELDDVISLDQEVITPFVVWAGGLIPPRPGHTKQLRIVTFDELLSPERKEPRPSMKGWGIAGSEFDPFSAQILRRFRDAVLLPVAPQSLPWGATS